MKTTATAKKHVATGTAETTTFLKVNYVADHLYFDDAASPCHFKCRKIFAIPLFGRMCATGIYNILLRFA